MRYFVRGINQLSAILTLRTNCSTNSKRNTMKKTICLIVLMLAYNLYFSEAQQLFQKKYLMDYTAAQNIQFLNSSNDSYCLSITDSFKINLARVDSLGSLVWARTFGRDSMRNFPISLTVLDNDDVIVGMYSDDGAFGSVIKDCILKFDQNGNNLFIKKYNGQSATGLYVLYQIIKDGSGFTAVIADFNSTPFPTARIIKMNPAGNRLMSVSFPNLGVKIFKSSAKNYYVYNNGLGTIVKLDSSFNYLTSKFFSFYPFPDVHYDMLELPDSTLLLAGGTDPSYGCYIDKFDKDLNSIWRGQYGYQSLEIGNPVELNLIDNNTIMVLTTPEGGMPNQRNGIFTIDVNGVVKKSGLFKYTKSATTYLPTQSDARNGKYLFLNAEVTPTNQFATYFNIYSTDTTLSNLCNFNDTLINYVILPSDFQDSVLFTIVATQDSLINETMTISNFNLVYGECSDSTLNIESPFSNENSVILFPNPISNELTIQAIGRETKEIILYDIVSKKLIQAKFTNTISINTEQLAKGIYIYEVRNKNGVIKKGKVVKD